MKHERLTLQGILLCIAIVGCLLSPRLIFALNGTGVINPANDGSYTAIIMETGSLINFGYFTDPAVPTATDVAVESDKLTGYMWGEEIGWVSLNCENTASCGTVDFGVQNEGPDGDIGFLTGYAWGENVGWINFGPPLDGYDEPNVYIDIATGEFYGYAWGENIGWIEFNCDVDDACVKTDWYQGCNDGLDNDEDGQTDYPNDTECTSANDDSENPPQCNDGIDNNSNGVQDHPNDPGCSSLTDITESSPVCSDLIDNDSDGLTDYPEDTDCASATDRFGESSVLVIIAVGGGDGSGGSVTLGGITVNFGPVVTGGDTPGSTGPQVGQSDSSPATSNITIPKVTVELPDLPFPTLDDVPTVDLANESTNRPLQDIFNSSSDFATNAINSQAGRTVSDIVTGAGIAVGVTSTVPTLITIINISEIAFAPFRLASLFLSALGIRRKSWGTVFDSVTKQPLDPAHVILRDMTGNEVATAITDLDGRYGFLTKPGTYTLEVAKTNYTFPSEKLKGLFNDGFYQDLYFGGALEVLTAGSVINKNIPMDPTGADWNELAKREKKLMRFYTQRKKIIMNVSQVFFYLGFLLSIFVVIVTPKAYTISVLVFYALVFILRRIGIKPKLQGTVVEHATGFGIPFSVVRVYSEQAKVQIKHCVADARGRYYCLVGKGRYYVEIEKKNDDGTYQKIFTSPTLDIKNGVINQTFEV